MKKLLTLNILTLLFICCAINKEKNESEFYIENGTSFFSLKNYDLTKNTWIRKTENLKTIHESFKKFGYDKLENLFSKNERGFIIEGIYIKRNFKNVMDSLELSYYKPEIKVKYYTEFWNRRKVEKNDSIVYEILKEFNSMKSTKNELKYENHFVNDTLVDLLSIEFDNKNINAEKAELDFYKLKKYGLHQSAYNLLFERIEYSGLKLNREKLKQELTKTKDYKEPWLIDNEK
jgi:hypothetical protein